jgi:glycosyltransferase involved in cell wall biosynthesis
MIASHRYLLRVASFVSPVMQLLPRTCRDKIVRVYRKWLVPKAPQFYSHERVGQGDPLGVNLFGLLSSPSGVGEAARASRECLIAGKIAWSETCIEPDHLFRGKPLQRPTAPYCTNLVHLNADVFDFGLNSIGIEQFRGRVNIAYWAWELDTFPSDWDYLFSSFDEIWVCSNFVQRAISRRAPIPVNTIPIAISPPPNLQSSRSEFGIPEGRPVILAAFDMASYPERKNPWGAIEAFKRVRHHPSQPVLVLKVGAGEVQPEVIRRLRIELESLNAILVDKWLDRDALWRLLSCCDIFVSLHRSEGYGLLLAEAMSLGKCVVGTAYSGNMDFMSPANSLLVRYHLEKLDKSIGPYAAGNRWAEPDLADAVAKLEYALSAKDAVSDLRKRAAVDIHEMLHPQVVGEMMQDRLKARKLL